MFKQFNTQEAELLRSEKTSLSVSGEGRIKDEIDVKRSIRSAWLIFVSGQTVRNQVLVLTKLKPVNKDNKVFVCSAVVVQLLHMIHN